MSSKSAQGQGRRTPLTLNPQAKSVPQSQGKQSTVETRGKQALPAQQKPQEQKKEAANNAAAASAAGPGPGPTEKTVSKQQQQNANLKNGLNNGNESKPTTANTNGNKAVAATSAVVEPKKEIEIRAKPAKPAEVQQPQQQVKNGADAAAKAAFAANNAAGNAAQRKQQQKQTTPQKQQPPQQQAQAEATKAAEEEIITVDEPPKDDNVVVVVPENVKTTTPKKVENSNQEQKIPTGTPTKPSTPKSSGKKRTVTSAIDVDEINASPKKAEESKPVIEQPTATSTPGKPAKIAGANVNLPRTPLESIPRKSIISARPSIRTDNEWSPSKFGTYRAINTDLDLSAANTSLNVTVGSEPGNNTSWFSFGPRKRERTPTSIENVQDDVLSPKKRARFGGILSIMASPFTALRSRFAKTSIRQACEEEEQVRDEENNVSMGEEVSMIEIQEEEEEDTPATENINDTLSVNKEAEQEAHIDPKQYEEKKKQIETDTDSPLDASADGATTERCNMM